MQEGPAEDCEDGWIAHEDGAAKGCFKHYPELRSQSWEQARTTCSQETDAHLPYVLDQKTAKFIGNKIGDGSTDLWTLGKVEWSDFANKVTEPYWYDMRSDPNVPWPSKKTGWRPHPWYDDSQPAVIKTYGDDDKSCVYMAKFGDTKQWKFKDFSCSDGNSNKHVVCMKTPSRAMVAMGKSEAAMNCGGPGPDSGYLKVKVEIDPSSLHGLKIGYRGTIEIDGMLTLDHNQNGLNQLLLTGDGDADDPSIQQAIATNNQVQKIDKSIDQVQENLNGLNQID